MPRAMTVSGSTVIAADPSVVYAAVSDPTQTGRWSPENLGASVPGRPGPLDVDDVFVGRNKRGPAKWATRCRVIEAVVEQKFSFRVEAIGVRKPKVKAPIAIWTYELQPVPGGTQVTETWTDLRRSWPDGLAKVFDKIATGSSFVAFNKRNIDTTLANLKRTLEGE